MMSDQFNAGATSETTETWKTIHTIRASNKANMKGWLWRLNDILGPCGAKASWHLSSRWGKTPKNPEKNLTQEICPDQGSNLRPLRDRRVCHRLFLSDGLSRFPLPHSFYHFSTLISFIQFHFTSSAPVMVRQVSSVGNLSIFKPSIKRLHLVRGPSPVSDPSWGYLFIYGTPQIIILNMFYYLRFSKFILVSLFWLDRFLSH